MKYILSTRGVKVELENNEDLKKIKMILKKYFVINYKDPITKFRKSINLYENINKIIYLPRHRVLEFADYIYNINDVEKIKMRCLVNLNSNQRVVENYILCNYFTDEKINKGLNNFILKAQAGSGKTYIALSLIKHISRKTLIIVPNTYLLEQWLELLIKFYPDNKTTTYYGKKKDMSGDIVVAIVNSISKCDLEFIENYSFGAVFLDEVHMYNTTSFKCMYTRINFKFMIGLSATPELRKDGFDKLACYQIGEILDTNEIKGYQKADNKFTSTVHLVYYNGPDNLTETIINEKNGMVDTISMITNIINDEYRNKLIIKSIIKLSKLKHNIFIFSDRRIHLENLFDMLKNTIADNDMFADFTISMPESSLILYGGSSKDDINTAKTSSSIIFTSYQYSSTGVSIDRLDALILATPRRSNMTQIVNRIFRLNEIYKENERYIIDIIDNSTVLKNQVSDRKKAYVERECEFKKSIVNYTDMM